MNFLYFSGVLFLISVLTIVFASYSSPAPDPVKIKGLTFASLDRAALRASWDRKDVIGTAIVLGLVALIYIYFSFWLG
jgi:SSS family solute:Na+ symporter